MFYNAPMSAAGCSAPQAEVQGKNQDGGIQLHTRTGKFGKVWGFNCFCGAGLVAGYQLEQLPACMAASLCGARWVYYIWQH